MAKQYPAYVRLTNYQLGMEKKIRCAYVDLQEDNDESWPFKSVDQHMWVGPTKEEEEKLVSCLIPKFWIFSKWRSIWTPCPSLMMALISLPPVTFKCLWTQLVIPFYWLRNFCVSVCATSLFVHHWCHWSYRFHLHCTLLGISFYRLVKFMCSCVCSFSFIKGCAND